MSFIRSAFAARPLHTVEEYMRVFITQAEQAGMPDVRGAAICAAMCAFQEAGADLQDGRGRQIWCPGSNADPCFRDHPESYPHDSMGDDHRSTGPFQQQMNAPGEKPWGWGGNYGDCEGTRRRMDWIEATRMFYSWPGSGLKSKSYDVSSAKAANDSVQRVQGSSVPNAYGQWYQMAIDLYNRVIEHNPANDQEDAVTISGDPVWLEDVLREALGARLVVEPDWKERGVGGTMGAIWGTMIHHTGNVNESVAVIRDGVKQPSGWLQGPLSQGLIEPDGTVHLIAVGPCNHAGGGNWGSLTDGNRQAIGFECAYSGSGPWPQKQIISMRDVCAAISKHLGKRANDSVCGHKEYAKPQGRKPDPGNMDMNWFRGEVQKDLDGFAFPGETAGPFTPPAPVPPTPPPAVVPAPEALTQAVWDQTSGRWEMLGWRTPVEALAVILDAVLKVDNTGATGFTREAHPIVDKPRAE